MKTLTQVESDPPIEEDSISTMVTLLENGLPSCTLIANNYKGKQYLQNIKLYSSLTVKYAYEDTGAVNWSSISPVFNGRIIDISPTKTSRGETLTATAIAGDCLKQMRVNSEYGTDMVTTNLSNPTNWTQDYSIFYGSKFINEDKVVDSRSLSNDANDTLQWTKVNTSPYLHDDDDTNYISEASLNECIGYYQDIFDFTNFDANYDKFTPDSDPYQCYLDVKARLYDGPDGHANSVTLRVRAYIAHNDTWTILGYAECTSTSYQTARFYIGFNINCLEDVNNFKIKIDISAVNGGGAGKGGIRVTYSYIHLTGIVQYHYTGWCHTVVPFGPGHLEYIKVIGCPTDDRLVFNRACAYHEQSGHVEIFYRWGSEGDWIQIGDNFNNSFKCRYPGADNPNNPTDEELNSYVLGPPDTELQVRWLLTVPLFFTGCFANFYIYYTIYSSIFETLYYDKLREILTDSNIGVIPKYINKILGTNDSSQYTLDTDYIYDYQERYSYLNFPYVDGIYVLDELIKMGSSLDYVKNESNYRGLHWIVTCDNPNKLLIAPIGDHHVYGKNSTCFIEDIWSTRCPLEELVVSEDMIISDFKHEIPVSNYVLVAGKYKYPINDNWTEDLSGWIMKYDSVGGITVPSAHLKLDRTRLVKNTSSLQWKFVFPAPGAQRMFGILYREIKPDFLKLISRDSQTYINLQIYGLMKGEELKLRLYCNNDTSLAYDGTVYYTPGSYFETDLSIHLKDTKYTNEWNMIEIPITIEDIRNVNESATWKAVNTSGQPAPNWENVKLIGIWYRSGLGPVLGGSDVWYIDDICFTGNAIRGVYTNDCGQSTIDDCKIGCIKHYGCRMTTIRDSLACTDTLDSTDLSSPLSQVALYELLRLRVPRISGSVQIPLQTNILPGQLIHIKTCQNESGVYKIDKDFRITRVQHRFEEGGAVTILDLVDDLKNSLPVNTLDPYTVLIRAINPDTQTKTYTSLKTEGTFITGLEPITTKLDK